MSCTFVYSSEGCSCNARDTEVYLKGNNFVWSPGLELSSVGVSLLVAKEEPQGVEVASDFIIVNPIAGQLVLEMGRDLTQKRLFSNTLWLFSVI